DLAPGQSAVAGGWQRQRDLREWHAWADRSAGRAIAARWRPGPAHRTRSVGHRSPWRRHACVPVVHRSRTGLPGLAAGLRKDAAEPGLPGLAAGLRKDAAEPPAQTVGPPGARILARMQRAGARLLSSKETLIKFSRFHRHGR